MVTLLVVLYNSDEPISSHLLGRNCIYICISFTKFSSSLLHCIALHCISEAYKEGAFFLHLSRPRGYIGTLVSCQEA